MNSSKKDNLSIWTVFICFFSVISQLPMFVTSSKTQLVCFPIWIICFGLFLFISKGKIARKSIYLLIPTLIFLILVGVDCVVNSVNYLSSSLLYSVLISIFVFLVGMFIGESCSDKLYKRTGLSYVITTLIVTLAIFFKYFGFSFNLSSRTYAYASKNSVAQIIFTAMIILFLQFRPHKKLHVILKYIVLAIELIVMLLLRSRAVILELGVCLIVVFLSKNTDKRLKKLMFAVGILAIALLLSSDSIRNAVINNILLAGRNAKDLDDLSSGRISILSQFPSLIDGHWLFGVGPTYYECFPLSSILQFGLIPGLLLIIISAIPFAFAVKYKKQSSEWYLLYIISIGYLINGLFEGITPFGAGIKCFFMWYLFGILLAKLKSALRVKNEYKNIT